MSRSPSATRGSIAGARGGAARSRAAEWQALVDRLTAGIAKGELEAAMARAAAEAADMLAPHFPPSAESNCPWARRVPHALEIARVNA